MTTNITGTDVWSDPIVAPSDGEAASAASVNTAFQDCADRDTWLSNTCLTGTVHLDVMGARTVTPPGYVGNFASTPGELYNGYGLICPHLTAPAATADYYEHEFSFIVPAPSGRTVTVSNITAHLGSTNNDGQTVKTWMYSAVYTPATGGTAARSTRRYGENTLTAAEAGSFASYAQADFVENIDAAPTVPYTFTPDTQLVTVTFGVEPRLRTQPIYLMGIDVEYTVA